VTNLPLTERDAGGPAKLTAGSLLGTLAAFGVCLALLIVRIERTPLARDPRLLDYAHVTLATLCVAFAFGSLVLGFRLLAARAVATLGALLARRFPARPTELVLRAWLEIGVPTFLVGWLMTTGTRAWTPNVTVWILLGAALAGSVGLLWLLEHGVKALRPRARAHRAVTLAVVLAVALGGALIWAAITGTFGLRYGKSHLLTFGLLVTGLSLVAGEALEAFDAPARGRVWQAGFALAFLASILGFTVTPSAAARELFYAERPMRWFGLALARLGPDTDGDGYERPIGFSAGGDCDDQNPQRSPIHPEIVGNGLDDNCFGGDQQRAFREFVAGAEAARVPGGRVSDVLVIVLDSFRFDVRTENGVHAELTPGIAAFARESLAFSDYRTCAPRTLESFGDLFFGRLVPSHRGAAPSSAIARLTRAGVHTVDISSRFRHEHDRVSGWAEEVSIPGRYGEFDDGRTVEETKRVLRSGMTKPFFVTVHLMGAHEPYDPLPACAERAEGYERYRCALRLLDARVEDILRTVSEQGLAGDTVVVVSADHGEEFGEHGARYHAHTVYDEVLRVPLLVRIPGARPEVVREPAGCFDFMPTLLGAANLPADPALIGHDFSRAERPRHRAQFARTRPLDAPGPFEPKTLSVVAQGTKLVIDRQSGLSSYFDLRSDPGERRPLAHVAASTERALKENMDAWLSELARQSVPDERTASAKR
jgi:glucan phosphoethanolaminetransferase (alkaline phosphatase superfamily)